MPWSEETWTILRRAAAYIPPAIRMEAILTIVEASEEEARARGSPVVDNEDLAKAAIKKIPTNVRPLAISVLEELGLDVSRYT
jgi:2-phosphoglycerate kinase